MALERCVSAGAYSYHHLTKVTVRACVCPHINCCLRRGIIPFCLNALYNAYYAHIFFIVFAANQFANCLILAKQLFLQLIVYYNCLIFAYSIFFIEPSSFFKIKIEGVFI